MDSERFDVDAKAPEEHVLSRDGFPRQTWLMLRALLAERFNLGVRSEKREGPVYELVTANADGRLGPRLRRSDVDCGVVMMMSIRGERAMNPTCSFAPYPGRLVATAVTMPDLASVLSETVDRGVVDRTSLEGNFDLDVEGVEFRPKGPFGPSSRPSDTTESLFTTLPEQLGLKLEPRNGFREIIIVDHAEMPALEGASQELRAALPSTGKPSRSAAAASRSSRHTIPSVAGRPSAAAHTAASWRASAARRSCTRSSRRALSRRGSEGWTSCHVAANRSKRPRAAAADLRRRRPSRSRREIADSHSTRVPHQARTPASDR
jgi:uncharacterized protein (TIGR03435 family)